MDTIDKLPPFTEILSSFQFKNNIFNEHHVTMSESKKTPDEYTIEDRERSSVIFLIGVSEQQILRYALKWSE